MKHLITTEQGGHPFTLNDLGFIQESYLEGIQVILASMVGSQPCILSGMQYTTTNSTFFPNRISPGYFWDGNEILQFDLFYIPPPGVPAHIYLNKVTENLPPVTYKTGQSKNVHQVNKLEASLTLVSGGSNFDFFAMPYFRTLMGNSIIVDWTNMSNKPILYEALFPINNIVGGAQTFFVQHLLNHDNYAPLYGVEFESTQMSISNYNGHSIVMHDRTSNSCKITVNFPNMPFAPVTQVTGYLKLWLVNR